MSDMADALAFVLLECKHMRHWLWQNGKSDCLDCGKDMGNWK